MFRMGGPIKEGVMNGIREPKNMGGRMLLVGQHPKQFRDKGGTGGGLKPVHSYQVIITGGKAALDGSMAGDAIGRVIGLTLPAAGRFFSGNNIKKTILDAKRITSMMFHDMEVNGELDDQTLNNTICNKVYDYAEKYTDLTCIFPNHSSQFLKIIHLKLK